LLPIADRNGQHAPLSLRSLLLAGHRLVSTQQAVTPDPKAVFTGVPLLWANWAWLGAASATAALTWLSGSGAAAPLAAASALAMAPALAGFVMAPRLGQWQADLALMGVWLVAAIGLAGETGGAASPLAALFATIPAWAIALGRRWAPEAGAAAVLGYAAAAGLAAIGGGHRSALGAYPELLAVVSLAFAAALMALGQRSGRSDVVGQRIAEVSHELRTPLTHILGFSEMIERKLFGEIAPRYVEYAGLIRKSGAHLLDLVNDLLDLSKIEAGRYDLEREHFDIRGVVEEVVRLSTDAAERKAIALGMVTPEAPLMVNADVRALKRILINTVGNALKFTPENGRVIVAARAEGDALVLETVDNGPGIAPAERGRIGSAYERGADAAGIVGTGLGLAMVRALAELHGGALSLEEAPGGGALVRVTLPVLAANAAGS
jgi:signal transduction histidine kinase